MGDMRTAGTPLRRTVTTPCPPDTKSNTFDNDVFKSSYSITFGITCTPSYYSPNRYWIVQRNHPARTNPASPLWWQGVSNYNPGRYRTQAGFFPYGTSVTHPTRPPTDCDSRHPGGDLKSLRTLKSLTTLTTLTTTTLTTLKSLIRYAHSHARRYGNSQSAPSANTSRFSPRYRVTKSRTCRCQRTIFVSFLQERERLYPSPVRKQVGFQVCGMAKRLARVLLNHAPPRWRRSRQCRRSQSVATFTRTTRGR